MKSSVLLSLVMTVSVAACGGVSKEERLDMNSSMQAVAGQCRQQYPRYEFNKLEFVRYVSCVHDKTIAFLNANPHEDDVVYRDSVLSKQYVATELRKREIDLPDAVGKLHMIDAALQRDLIERVQSAERNSNATSNTVLGKVGGSMLRIGENTIYRMR